MRYFKVMVGHWIPELNRLINTKWDIQFTFQYLCKFVTRWPPNVCLHPRVYIKLMLIANEYINKNFRPEKQQFLEMYDGLEDVVGLFRPPPSDVIAVVTWSDVYDLHGNHYLNLQSLTNKTHTCYKQTWASLWRTHFRRKMRAVGDSDSRGHMIICTVSYSCKPMAYLTK